MASLQIKSDYTRLDIELEALGIQGALRIREAAIFRPLLKIFT